MKSCKRRTRTGGIEIKQIKQIKQIKRYSFFRNAYYALSGVWEVFKSEKAFRIEVLIGGTVLVITWLSRVSYLIKLLITSAVMNVFSAEMINSAVEKLTDVVMPYKDERAKFVKDAGSACVFWTIVAGVIVFVGLLFELVGKTLLLKGRVADTEGY